ncbi:MAG: hypothetical protein ACXABY_05080 [Candidatus Thorarchaeota archaeon]|jgi:hypothetical protein
MSRKVSLDLERSPVGMGIRKVGQWVTYDQFTDGGGAAGTLALSKVIPAGSFVLGSKVRVTTGFTGDTTAVLDIGDGSDADLFSLTTHNVLAAASNLVEGAAAGTASDSYSGIVPIASDATVTLTVTGASDFGLITAGKMYVEVFYFSTNPEVIDKVSTRYDG